MAAPGENKTRAALVRGGLIAVVIAGFVVTVAVLNGTVYSAPGFVKGYLDALDRGDTTSALRLAGVQPEVTDDLLTVPEKGAITGVEIVRDTSTDGGGRRITVAYRLDGTRHEAPFVIERAGSIAGLFHAWRFTTAPTASLDVTPMHDARFTADGVEVTSPGADIATRYTVLAPAVFDLGHSTTYLTAAERTAVVASPGSVSSATVTVVPRASFVGSVRRDVTKYLRTTCLPQKVLQPSGCPFGQEVDDRVTSTPAWTMRTYPPVALRPTSTPGVWLVAAAKGTAHLRVGAQSLYDGHAYTVDQDVPFTVSYVVTIGSDNALTISPR